LIIEGRPFEAAGPVGPAASPAGPPGEAPGRAASRRRKPAEKPQGLTRTGAECRRGAAGRVGGGAQVGAALGGGARHGLRRRPRPPAPARGSRPAARRVRGRRAGGLAAHGGVAPAGGGCRTGADGVMKLQQDVIEGWMGTVAGRCCCVSVFASVSVLSLSCLRLLPPVSLSLSLSLCVSLSLPLPLPLSLSLSLSLARSLSAPSVACTMPRAAANAQHGRRVRSSRRRAATRAGPRRPVETHRPALRRQRPAAGPKSMPSAAAVSAAGLVCLTMGRAGSPGPADPPGPE
jgi:hypothetical protein